MSTATREYVTKGGAKFVLKESITYGESRKIAMCYAVDTAKVSPAEILQNADKATVEVVVVSINGETTDLYKHFCNLPLADAKEVTPLLKEITDPKGSPAPTA